MLLLRDVKKSFVEPGGEPLPILDVPEFRLEAGEHAALVGRSGSGKTTLLHVIAGISRPDSGLVQIDGRDITRLAEAGLDRFRADKIGYVFQTFNLLPGFCAGKRAVGNGLCQRPARRVAGANALGARRTRSSADAQATMLSVGEQQRVAVARALANRPKILLADEPTANVDTRHQQQVIDLVRESCRAESVALLLVTHAPEVAEQFERVENLEQLQPRR